MLASTVNLEAETVARLTVELEMAREEAQQRLEAAVGAERVSMQREMDELADSLKQDYEAKLASTSTVARATVSTATTGTGTGSEQESQTEFNPGDSAVDQRVTFAVAQQQLEDEKKFSAPRKFRYRHFTYVKL